MSRHRRAAHDLGACYFSSPQEGLVKPKTRQTGAQERQFERCRCLAARKLKLARWRRTQCSHVKTEIGYKALSFRTEEFSANFVMSCRRLFHDGHAISATRELQRKRRPPQARLQSQ